MEILPRVNFLFSMIPLPPPAHFYQDLYSACRKFIWNGKPHRSSITTLQPPENTRGLALPDFKFYLWAFRLKTLKIWLQPNSVVPWKTLENALLYLWKIQDLLFSNTKLKDILYQSGFIIHNGVDIWRQINKYLSMSCNLHDLSSLCNNNYLLYRNVLFVSPCLTEV